MWQLSCSMWTDMTKLRVTFYNFADAPKKAQWIRLIMKTMLIVVFDCWGLVCYEFVHGGQTVNQEFCLTILWCM